MKIQKKQFQISELCKLSLSSNIHIHNLNIVSFLHFTNYKTYALNSTYLKLLPQKIFNLRELKNTLLNIKSQIKNNDSKTYNLYIDYPEVYNNLIGLDLIKPIDTAQIETNNNINECLKVSIKQIEKAINTYQKELKNYTQKFEYKINAYDLDQLQHNKLTNNSKKALYYYLIKLKKVVNSNRTESYINGYIPDFDLSINELLTNYTNNLKEIKKDFDLFLSSELKVFENQFLNRSL